jgi:hypothetical protein
MDTARVTAIIVPKRRAQGPVLSVRDLVSDGPVDYVGRHTRRSAPAPQSVIADHPRAHGFSILSRLARADDLTAAAV